MIVLSRRLRESIMVGTDMVIVLEDIGRYTITLSVQHGARAFTQKVKRGNSVSLADSVAVCFAGKRGTHEARIGIVADRSIRVLRAEVAERISS